jgi:hypothetical protein
MALTFNHARIKGVISATEADHPKAKLDINQDILLFNEVRNTAHEAINNGVIVSLTNGSKWTVAGTSYLTRLTLSADASVDAADGHGVSMTVDGRPTALDPGKSYTGAIVLTLK